MRVLFSGAIRLDYGQLYAVSSGCADATIEAAFRGQSNGLCGARVRGALLFLCGSHSENVQLEVTLHDAEPPLEAAWTEVVEAPFHYLSEPPSLQDWDGNLICELPITGPGYVVRWAACHFGEAEDLALASDGEPHEEYSLSIWPSADARERIVRSTSEKASYWHKHVQTL